MVTFTEQIARGTAVLDAHSPHGPGWVFHVDTDRLDMSRWNECVLGQLYGEFYEAAERLAARLDSYASSSITAFVVAHGFEIRPEVGKTFTLDEYRALAVEWRTHITELRFRRRALLDDTQSDDTQKEEVNEHE